jgi:hypothetical protein
MCRVAECLGCKALAPSIELGSRAHSSRATVDAVPLPPGRCQCPLQSGSTSAAAPTNVDSYEQCLVDPPQQQQQCKHTTANSYEVARRDRAVHTANAVPTPPGKRAEAVFAPTPSARKDSQTTVPLGCEGTDGRVCEAGNSRYRCKRRPAVASRAPRRRSSCRRCFC